MRVFVCVQGAAKAEAALRIAAVEPMESKDSDMAWAGKDVRKALMGVSSQRTPTSGQRARVTA